ncbi:class I tRNA ligase family protein, partial [Patescibacteria group bacterium]|nr:class I tRNA ligase family protein [Patescibacteria group bacterium]
EFPRATGYIPQQIALAETLEQKGFAYRTKHALYFDTSKFPSYGKLAGVSSAELIPGARIGTDPDKHHPADFALWKQTPIGTTRQQEWSSPWGRGFPGWHLECSAMARTLLGPEIDIHTGGEDLAPVHHNNEIAQSEAASGRPFAHYWLHNAFLTMDGEKISKSLGNFIYLSDIVARGMHPLALRYFFLQAHYRTPLSFSFDALAAAEQGLVRLWRIAREIADSAKRVGLPSPALERFVATVRDDVATPAALGVLWEELRSDELSDEEKWMLITVADEIFGLSLTEPPEAAALRIDELPEDIRALLAKRDAARQDRDYAEADRLRGELENSGYRVDDGPSGTIVTRRAE